MKIIKRGDKHEEPINTHTCLTCDSILEFVKSETKVTHSQQDGNYMEFECPVCNSTCKHWMD